MSDLRYSAPLLDAYLSYFESARTPFTIPGHKQRASQLDAGLGAVVDPDTPLYGGLDEIKLTHQVLKKAESLAAQLWGADYARFSTGGSTHANQAIVLSLGAPGEKVAISRTAHRSILSALVLAGLEPIWMSPEIDVATGVPTGIAPAELAKALEENPIAVLLTEPGYLGTISDLPALIDLAHKKKIPVILDAAWGGHFGFHENLPRHAFQLGADALITSTHKALPGYSASALLLARTELLSAERLEQSFETTHTTSPAGGAGQTNPLIQQEQQPMYMSTTPAAATLSLEDIQKISGVGTNVGWLGIFDPDKGKLVASWPRRIGTVSDLEFLKDGKTLVFGAIWGGGEQLYARPLDQLSAAPISGPTSSRKNTPRAPAARSSA